MQRIIEFKNLFDRNHTNDYYYIQYVASLLDYIERGSTGFLTDLGRKSLALDINAIHLRLYNKETLCQKDLVRFCLYMTDSYVCTVMFIGMCEVAFETKEQFFQNHPLPSGVIEDFKMLSAKAIDLKEQYKTIMDRFAPMLDSKHRTIYNEEKIKAFVKQIFANTHIQLGSSMFRPAELDNAKEVK